MGVLPTRPHAKREGVGAKISKGESCAESDAQVIGARAGHFSDGVRRWSDDDEGDAAATRESTEAQVERRDAPDDALLMLSQSHDANANSNSSNRHLTPFLSSPG